MYILLALSLLSFFSCLFLTRVFRDLAVSAGFVDHPDANRKLHHRPIPRVGGVPIMLSYTAALGACLAIERYVGRDSVQHQAVLKALLPAAAIIFATGLADDLFNLRPWQKILGQLIGSLVAVRTGIILDFGAVHSLGRSPVWNSAWINGPASVLWLIGCSNAVNLIDGLDGLAAGAGLFATGTALIFGLITGNAGLVLVTMPLVACLLAFLCFNMNPASVFLGDSGSLTIGFLLGCFALIWYRHSTSLLELAAPVMVLALPLLDVLLAICRRYLRRTPLFAPDRGHIHHMMLARGFSPKQTAWALYATCLAAATLALLQGVGHTYVRVTAVVLFFALILGGVRYLNYVELGAARHIFSARRMLNVVRGEIDIRDIEGAIRAAGSDMECWHQVQKTVLKLGFCNIRMFLAGTYFERAAVAVPREVEWKITLPLASTGFLILVRAGNERAPHLTMETLDRLQGALAARENQKRQVRFDAWREPERTHREREFTQSPRAGIERAFEMSTIAHRPLKEFRATVERL